MKYLISFLLYITTLSTTLADVAYDITYDTTKISVVATFDGSGQDKLVIPTANLSPHYKAKFHNFITLEGNSLKQDNTYIITYSANNKYKIKYDIDITYSEPPLMLSGDKKFIYMPSWTLPIITSLLDNESRQQIMVKFNLPQNYNLISTINYPHNNNKNISYFNGSFSELLDNNFLISLPNIIKTRKIKIGSKSSTVLFVGINDKNQKILESKIKKVYTSQMHLFNTSRVIPVSIFVSGHIADMQACANFHNNIAYFLSNDSEISVNTIAHEYMHNYINYSLLDQETGKNQWFAEGFNEYYARKTNLNFNIISAKEYLAHYNRTIAFSAARLLNGVSLKTLESVHSFSDDISDRGIILAQELDHHIQVATNGKKSLDDIIAKMIKQAQQGNKFTILTLKKEINLLAGKSLDYLFDEILEKGNVSILSHHILPNTARVKSKIFIPDMGFDSYQAKINGIVSGLKSTDIAYKAGIRNGDKIDLYSPSTTNFSYYAEPTKIDVPIIKANGTKIISYITNTKVLDIPQYEIVE